jgi:hypothetical protein
MCRGWSDFGAGPNRVCIDGLDNFADETRLGKIDKLRKALAEKTYHVSDADLAGKIIEHMRRP